MRFSFVSSLLLAGASAVSAASSWSFDDATMTVQAKGAGVGGGVQEKLDPTTPLSKSIALGATDTLKIILSTVEGKKAKRPHQAFLTLTDPKTGLEDAFALSVKDNGKGKVELTQKDLPYQFITTSTPLKAALVIASFGSSEPYKADVFDVEVKRDPNVPLAIPEPPVRYGKKDEIHHIFKEDPRNPPKMITLVFAAAVAATLPVLLIAWVALGANVNHLPKALGAAPASHALFFGSVVALEGIFFLYYTCWNLFQTLPAVGAVGVVALLSGSRALSEVQERRLSGQR
ncbi:Oligosaccharyltransferase subunit Ribophorin II-domain-containing protein [Phyllosticta capitalensis]|uniref:Oligosaccharyltransferase subunit Ribophorin II-domain-containing protein n=1 Tax=Phyllosticta capitalensis TaxID=121624 RepID=A0ABR1YTG6_9PEZI